MRGYSQASFHFGDRSISVGFLSGSDSIESTGNAGDQGSIPGMERSHGEGKGNHSNIPAWRIPWTEGPGGLKFMGSQRVGHD